MKTLKYFALLLALGICSSLFLADAASTSAGWAPVTLGRYQEGYTSNSYSKTVEGYQYIMKTSAVDSITGGDRGVEAKLTNSSLALALDGWTLTETDVYKAFTTDDRSNESGYNYKITLRASKSTFAKVDFYGTWFLNPTGIA